MGKPVIVTLCMIVKNEEAIIGRCLAVNRPHYDRVVIVDTGSTDRTEEVAKRALADVPHVFAKREWRGFGPGKTDALQLAVEHFGTDHYVLVLDADEILSGELPDTLDRDRYTVDMQLSESFSTLTARLFHLHGEWRYLGVLHEIPWSPHPHHEGHLPLILRSPRDGARGKNPSVYADDAALLERAIASLETAPPGDADGIPAALREGFLTRYRFYLAQSYRDAGNHLEAVRHYRRRAAMGAGMNWEEVYISHLETGRALARLDRHHESQEAFLAAHHSHSGRAEAIRELAVRFEDARRKKDETPPVGALFVELAPEQPRNTQEALDPFRALLRPTESPSAQSESDLEQWMSRQSSATDPATPASGLEDREHNVSTRGWKSLDKWKHYLPIYERHVPRTIHGKPVRLLEIGVQGGGSLAMWRHWLDPSSIIHGLDIDPSCVAYGIDHRVIIHTGSQSNSELLETIVDEMNGLDVVIDDGSHVSSDQWTSFETLFPHLHDDGVYIIEDVHASYWGTPPYDGGLRKTGSFIERIKDLIDQLHADYIGNPHAANPGIAATIHGIHIYDSIIVIEKCAPKPPAVRLVIA